MDPDAEDRQLKDGLRDVVESAAVRVAAGDFDRVERRARHLRRRQRGLAGIVAVVAVGCAVLVVARDDPAPVVDTGPTDTTAEVTVTFDPGAGALPEAPLEVRGDAAVVWTGSELVVWGGDVEAANMGLEGDDRSYADGAAYDPSTRSWRALATGPLPSSFETSIGVRVDAGVLFVRGTASALWDPVRNSWQQLEDAPAPVEDLVSTGGGAISYSALSRLDVETGRWTELPEPPEHLERPSVTWTGDVFVVVGGPGTAFTSAKALVYDPVEDAWRASPPAPGELTAAALAAGWDGRRVVVVDYDMRAAAYDPSDNRWTQLPSVPARFYEHYPSLVTESGTSLAFMALTVAVLTTEDAWVPVPQAAIPYGAAVPTGSGVVFAWNLDSAADRNVLATFEPAALATSPTSLQVGIGAIRVPQSYDLVSATVISPGSSGVRVEIAHGADSCTIASTYFGIEGPVLDEPVAETTDRSSGGALSWRRSADEGTWQTAATDSDLFQIECQDPDIARFLAETAVLP